MRFVNLFFGGHLDEEGEEIMEVFHRHPIVFFIDSYKVWLFGVIMPAGFYYLIPEAWKFSALWASLGVIGLIYYFIDWYFDAWLLTNNGVIDIERNGLFDRSSTRVDYHMIEGVAYRINGFWRTILNYGEITIDKLGAQTSVVLVDATAPKKIERKIVKYQERFVNEKSYRDHNALKGMLSEMIAYHVQSEKISNPDSK